MDSSFVQPTSVTPEMVIASTKPGSLKRKISLALLKLGFGRRYVKRPYVLWLSNKSENNKK